jgi:hypothetical protein
MTREETLEQLCAGLWRLPADERCALLILSCAELDSDALAVPLNLVGVASIMGEKLREDQRKALAKNMRQKIARLERRFSRPEFETCSSVVQFARKQ